jgi:hypothetical protein
MQKIDLKKLYKSPIKKISTSIPELSSLILWNLDVL